jgi:O-antigen biosynthesis protein
MSPLFPPRPKHWAPRGDGSVFFVGNVLHLPNQQAIEWIATRLSPALAAIGSSARLRIVGAAADSVPSHWRGVNVEYLGVADKATVTDEFCAADLFVAPIANPWGSKMKLLDCLAHGTPFAATTDALSGLPFLAGVPELRLDHPRQAAKVVAALLENPGRLIELSESSGRLLAAQLNAECGAWGRLLARVARFEPGDSRGM